MTFAAKIIADSISPAGVRLTTMEIVIPRVVLAEFNTHRMFSRNSASSRAIPHAKMINRVLENPYIPRWTKNQKGMSGEFLDPLSDEAIRATSVWLRLRDEAVLAVEALGENVHKQDVNRALEPWMWHTIIVTATEWSNFFHLRDHTAAHPGIQTPAKMMREVYETSEPILLSDGMWHTPYIQEADLRWVEESADLPQGGVPPGWHEHRRQQLCKISIGRCARVSYLTHDGKRDPQADIDLCDKLLSSGHMSPFEHVARPIGEQDLFKGYLSAPSVGGPRNLLTDYFSGNFRGWVQYRKTIPNEHDMHGTRITEP